MAERGEAWVRLAVLLVAACLAVLLALWSLKPVPPSEGARAPAEVEPAPSTRDAHPGDRPRPRWWPWPDAGPDASRGARPRPQGGGDTGEAIVPLGFVVGVVEDDRGRPVEGAIVWGDPELCPARFDSFDGAFNFAFPPGPCRLQGARRDGLLFARSEVVDVEIAAGEEHEVTLVVPAERTGGLGVAIREHPEGMRVDEVLSDTPAWEAGLQQGDVIVEVDGTPAALLSLWDFQAIMTGPEGTDVEFVLSWEGDTGIVEERLSATRAFLE